jgi:hypothetical protein
LFDDEREIPDYQSVTFDYERFPMTCESSNYGEYLLKTKSEIRYGNGFPNWPLNSTRIEIYGTKGQMFLGRHGGGWQVFGENMELFSQEYGVFPDEEHQIDFIESVRTRKKPNAPIEEGQNSATLVHLANLSYRVGQKQLLFDGSKERILNSEDANLLDNRIYRDEFMMPDEV